MHGPIRIRLMYLVWLCPNTLFSTTQMKNFSGRIEMKFTETRYNVAVSGTLIPMGKKFPATSCFAPACYFQDPNCDFDEVSQYQQ